MSRDIMSRLNGPLCTPTVTPSGQEGLMHGFTGPDRRKRQPALRPVRRSVFHRKIEVGLAITQSPELGFGLRRAYPVSSAVRLCGIVMKTFFIAFGVTPSLRSLINAPRICACPSLRMKRSCNGRSCDATSEPPNSSDSSSRYRKVSG